MVSQRNELFDARELGGHPTLETLVFLGSSGKAYHVVEALAKELKSKEVDPRPWKALEVFQLSRHTIESLESQANECQFAIFVLSSDLRVVHSDGVDQSLPSQNVVFELGLFMGRLNRQRCFVLLPQGQEIQILSDMSGVTWARYGYDPEGNLNITEASKKIRKAIADAPSRIGDSILENTIFPQILLNYCFRRFRRYMRNPLRLIWPFRSKCSAQITICLKNGRVVRHTDPSTLLFDVRRRNDAILVCNDPDAELSGPFRLLLNSTKKLDWVIFTDKTYSQYSSSVFASDRRDSFRVCLLFAYKALGFVYFLEIHQEIASELTDYQKEAIRLTIQKRAAHAYSEYFGRLMCRG